MEEEVKTRAERHKSVEVTCTQCGKKFMKKYSHVKKRESGNFFCSRECLAIYKKVAFAGENNHQFGLRGKLNASFKDGITKKRNNNLIDLHIYVENHPRANKNGRVLLHKYLVEQNYQLFNPKYFEEINGMIVLKKGIGVHHKNGNHDDNRIENLMPVTKAEHSAIHLKENAIIKCIKTGRILRMLKLGENTQPTLKVNVKKLHPDAVMPHYAHTTDCGADLTAISKTVDEYGNIVYGFGLAFEIPKGYAGFIYPRSSNCRTGLWLTNHVGVIDANFRGEVTAKFSRGKDVVNEYNIGDRVAQMVIMPYPQIYYSEVYNLSETDRGKGGYGSTGK